MRSNVAKAEGLTEDMISDLFSYSSSRHFTLREKAALRYAELFKQGEHAIDKDEVYHDLSSISRRWSRPRPGQSRHGRRARSANPFDPGGRHAAQPHVWQSAIGRDRGRLVIGGLGDIEAAPDGGDVSARNASL